MERESSPLALLAQLGLRRDNAIFGRINLEVPGAPPPLRGAFWAGCVGAPYPSKSSMLHPFLLFLLQALPLDASEFVVGVRADTTPEALSFSACSIPREPGLTLQAFRSQYKGKGPVIFPSPSSSAAAQRALGAHVLRENFGHLPVTLASSNSNSYAKQQSTLGAYLAQHLAPVTAADRADALWYLFGDTLLSPAWEPLHASLPPPPFDAPDDEPIYAWGVGGLHSGVPFHRHGAVYAEVMAGSKRWWLSPPHQVPAFHGNATQLSYALQHPAEEPGVLACTAHADEVLYIPAGWWHATLNLAPYTAFTSAFVREAPLNGTK